MTKNRLIVPIGLISIAMLAYAAYAYTQGWL